MTMDAILTSKEMATRYKCFKRGTAEPSTKAWHAWKTRNPEKVPPPLSPGKWLLGDVTRFEAEKPWLKQKSKQSGGRKRNCEFELRVS